MENNTLPAAAITQAPVSEEITATQATGEQAPDAAAPKQDATDKFTQKLELLARKERALWRERQTIAQEKQRIAEMEAKWKSYEEKKTKAKDNPLDYLSEAGLSYDELTQFMLNGGKPAEKSELQILREEFERLRSEQTEKEQRMQEQQQQAQAAEQMQVIEGFKSDIAEFVEANKSVYEISSHRDAVDDIYATISEAYAISLEEWTATGKRGPAPKLMDIKIAADLVEEFYEKEVMRLAETKKLKERLGIQQKAEQETKQPSKTLTNNMASTGPSLVPAKNDADRMRRAMEKLGVV